MFFVQSRVRISHYVIASRIKPTLIWIGAWRDSKVPERLSPNKRSLPIGVPARVETVDVLAFWGAFFSGIPTLVDVLITVRFTQREMKESSKHQQREKFIKIFGSTILEINLILGEITKGTPAIAAFRSKLALQNETIPPCPKRKRRCAKHAT